MICILYYIIILFYTYYVDVYPCVVSRHWFYYYDFFFIYCVIIILFHLYYVCVFCVRLHEWSGGKAFCYYFISLIWCSCIIDRINIFVFYYYVVSLLLCSCVRDVFMLSYHCFLFIIVVFNAMIFITHILTFFLCYDDKHNNKFKIMIFS